MKFFSTYKKQILLCLLFVFLFNSVAYLQKKYDTSVQLKDFFDPTVRKYIFPPQILKYFSFGFNNVLADFYWINIIQDYSGWNRADNFYINEYKNLVTLDPHFSYPYLFGILTISSKAKPENLIHFEPVTNIGLEALPYNWEIPFYLGTQFHLLKNDPKALYYLKIASSLPLTPHNVQYIYTMYEKKFLSGNTASQALIKTIYDTTTSSTTKKIIKNQIVINSLIQTLQPVIQNYKNKYGMYPSSLNDLIINNMIQVNTEFKTDFIITINKNTGEITIVSNEIN